MPKGCACVALAVYLAQKFSPRDSGPAWKPGSSLCAFASAV